MLCWFWVHLNVITIYQKMWTIMSKLKDNCPHFLWMLWMLLLPKYQPKRGGHLGWGKLFRFKCGIKNYFQLAKTNLRTQFNCNKILSFLSLISLVCLMFRNEERVVFIAIMLSCILLDFQSINLLSLKIFLLKIFQP